MEDVFAALLASAEGLPILEDQPPVAAIHSYTEHAVVYLLRLWCDSDDYWPNTFEANKRIKQNFDAKGIRLAGMNLKVQLEK
jgi:small conductance mechanosensitive channel